MLNSRGEIINQTSFQHIAPAFEPLIEHTLKTLQDTFPELHSLYLYGSIAEGRARPGLSDADFIVVFKQPVYRAEARLKKIAEDLHQSFLQQVCKVDLPSGTRAEILAPENLYGWGAYLKVLALPLWGEDLCEELPAFKPSYKMVRGWNGDLRQETLKALNRLQAPLPETEKITLRRGVAARLIRAFFMLAAAKELIWSTALPIQLQYVKRYFPEYATIFDYLFTTRQSTHNATHNAPQDNLQFIATLEQCLETCIPEFESILSRGFTKRPCDDKDSFFMMKR